jgi:hypothetical protein
VLESCAAELYANGINFRMPLSSEAQRAKYQLTIIPPDRIQASTFDLPELSVQVGLLPHAKQTHWIEKRQNNLLPYSLRVHGAYKPK